MGDTIYIKSTVIEPKTFKVDSGGINIAFKAVRIKFSLISKIWPHKELYKVKFGHMQNVYYLILKDQNDKELIKLYEVETSTPDKHFWFSFSNGFLKIGKNSDKKEIFNTCIQSNTVGYIKVASTSFFDTDRHTYPHVDCAIEVPPTLAKPIRTHISTGQLKWERLRNYKGKIPYDAFIAGMWHHPIYIVRMQASNHMKLGYFEARNANVDSGLNFAQLPQERDLHSSSSHVEILCGYDAEWVYPDSQVPANALICSPGVYIGRGYHQGHLLVGKVLQKDKICYTPYKGLQVKLEEYQILTSRESEPFAEAFRATFPDYPKLKSDEIKKVEVKKDEVEDDVEMDDMEMGELF